MHKKSKNRQQKEESVFSVWTGIVFYSIFWDIRKYVRRKIFLLSCLTIAYGQKIKNLGSKNVGFLLFLLKCEYNSSLLKYEQQNRLNEFSLKDNDNVIPCKEKNIFAVLL